jgi:hypothetical protein
MIEEKKDKKKQKLELEILKLSIYSDLIVMNGVKITFLFEIQV